MHSGSRIRMGTKNNWINNWVTTFSTLASDDETEKVDETALPPPSANSSSSTSTASLSHVESILMTPSKYELPESEFKVAYFDLTGGI